MALFVNTRPAPAISAGHVTRFIQNAIATVIDWNDERLTRKTLSQLTARELDDIGLNRGDIDTVARRGRF